MKKLPHITIREATAWQRERLASWLGEWVLDRSLRAHSAAEAVPLRPLHEGVQAPMDDVPAPERGQIRLFHPSVGPRDRLLYVAVLERPLPGIWVVAPFGRLSEPASPAEVLAGRTELGLRVLCLWNERVVAEGLLDRSWVVDALSDVEIEDASAVLRSHRMKMAVPADLERRVGPPIAHPLDPRIEYMEEERAVMDALARPVPNYEQHGRVRELARAADRYALYGQTIRLAVEGCGLVLTLVLESSGDRYMARVYDDRPAISGLLDGATLLSPEGGCSDPIHLGQAVVSSRLVAAGISLRMPSGCVLRLSRIG